jgi:hypothetical protein
MKNEVIDWWIDRAKLFVETKNSNITRNTRKLNFIDGQEGEILKLDNVLLKSDVELLSAGIDIIKKLRENNEKITNTL